MLHDSIIAIWSSRAFVILTISILFVVVIIPLCNFFNTGRQLGLLWPDRLLRPTLFGHIPRCQLLALDFPGLHINVVLFFDSDPLSFHCCHCLLPGAPCICVPCLHCCLFSSNCFQPFKLLHEAVRWEDLSLIVKKHSAVLFSLVLLQVEGTVCLLQVEVLIEQLCIVALYDLVPHLDVCSCMTKTFS